MRKAHREREITPEQRTLLRFAKREGFSHLHRKIVLVLSESFSINDSLQGVEIGVKRGVSARSMLMAFPNLHLVLIDPYASSTSTTAGDQHKHDNNLIHALHTICPWRSRTRLRIMTSEMAADYEEGPFDFVYVDGDHGYDGVMTDLRLWWPRIRPGGLMLGDDYHGRMEKHGYWGVGRAVDEFAAMTKDSFLYSEAPNFWYMSKCGST